MKTAFLAVLLCLLIGCGPSHDPTFIANRSGVLFYGDSIFGNWNLDAYFPGGNYVSGGYFGQRTDQLLARLPAALSGANVCSGFDGSGTTTPSTLKCGPIAPPRTVIIYAGWNNLFQATDPQQAALDIGKMTALCILAGAHPIIATLYHFDRAHPPSWDLTFDPEPYGSAVVTMDESSREIGKLYNIPVIDLEKVFTAESGYTVDGVHPDAFGYQQMHDAVVPLLN